MATIAAARAPEGLIDGRANFIIHYPKCMDEATGNALSAFDIASILVVTAAHLGWLNYHFIKLPHVIGLTVMGALAAIMLMVANAVLPGVTLDNTVAQLLQELDFTETCCRGC